MAKPKDSSLHLNFFNACRQGNLNYLKATVRKGFNLYSLKLDPVFPKEYVVEGLFTAIQSGHPNIVEFLFDKCEQDNFPIQIWEDYLDTASLN